MIRALVALGLALWLALVGAPALAATAPAYAGVWQGTIGTLPIRVCLDRHDYDQAGGGFGAYYYTRRLRLIQIEQQADSKAWNENPPDGKPALAQWRFDSVTPTLLTAQWTQASRVLPVRLTPAGRLGPDDQPCGSLLFNAPRLVGGGVKSTRGAKDGVGYMRLVYTPGPGFSGIELETFALDGRTPATTRVNALLRRKFGGDPAKSDWFECIAGSLSSHGSDGDYGQTIAPTMITAHWLAATDATDYYCGGAHPDSNVTSRTFDLDAGTEVDLTGWMGANAIKRERFDGTSGESKTLTPAFKTVVLRGWKPDDAECREPVATEDYWDIGLARGGLRFTPILAHVVQACADPIVVSFDRLAPWLNAHGTAEVARFRRSLAR